MKLRIFKYLLFCLIAGSCQTNKIKLFSDWREYRNDTVVLDYIFIQDTILRKYSGMSWFERIPIFLKNSIYYSKTDTSEVLKIISIIDSSNLIVNSGGPYDCKFVKLTSQKRILPNSITFDLIDPNSPNVPNINNGLGEGDYKLRSDGSYTFSINKKLYHGKISNDVKRDLDFFLCSIDTSIKFNTNHLFEIHQIKFNYRIIFEHSDNLEIHMITDKQPVQFTRLTFCLEKIWYKILKENGYQIL